jgi:hypothetical protein
MKKPLIIILIALVLIIAVYVYFKPKQGEKTIIDSIVDAIFPSKDKRLDNKSRDFLKSVGFGDNVLDFLSERDAQITEHYIKNYLRKGVKMTQQDPLFNEVTRIATLTNIFNKP